MLRELEFPPAAFDFKALAFFANIFSVLLNLKRQESAVCLKFLYVIKYIYECRLPDHHTFKAFSRIFLGFEEHSGALL